jgi:hypothetical protein
MRKQFMGEAGTSQTFFTNGTQITRIKGDGILLWRDVLPLLTQSIMIFAIRKISQPDN